ncbi:IS1634 family transposase, partial [Amphibacillus indicireducens]|uniref:IS1634 family transposase n=1 Tax=Amphibacillus indicireducens TaxID=1076330 RepID=UPI0031EF0717
KVKKSLEKPNQIKSQLKRGRNQYIALDADLDSVHLDEERIAYQQQFDGYYAVITNQLSYTTQEVTDIYGGLWQIEESFRVLKSDLRAHPVYVWTDEHIHGHFVLCFLSFSLMRYAQYLIQKKTHQSHSGKVLCHAFNEPMVLVQGDYPVVTVTPTNIPSAYFDVMKSLDMPSLSTNMTLAEFKKVTKLDLALNYQ